MSRVKHWIRINGARGSAMFFFGVFSLIFGSAFTGPWKVVPPPPAGLVGLDKFIPLEVWGYGWLLAAVFLILGAFRQNQSWAMAVFAGMLFVWFASYASTCVVQLLTNGFTTLGYPVALYGALLGAVLSVARLLNVPPPTTIEAVMTGEVELVMKEEKSGDDT